VYGKRCRIGGTLTLDDLAETSVSVKQVAASVT
jgi:hypothetical protein